MGVYIKDMEMPTQCYDCYIVANDPDSGKLYCKHLDTDIENWEGILPDCPLVEIATPHGDLIDRGELELDTEWDDRDVWYSAYSQAQISDAPVIIEAEGVPRKWWEPKCEVTNG